ncbi:MAG: gamma-glutamylcyclotransferase [Candidatus Helarchaeota archaeon]|nr:gamma-glutamylcyclotransferase [Candidatus Helarchaeota archaeon]
MNIDNEGFIAPREKPITYPGKIPKFSFMIEGEEFYEINIEKNKPLDQSIIEGLNLPSHGNKIAIYDFCIEKGIPNLFSRVAILSYGSNCNPAQLKHKFKPTDLKNEPIFAIECECSNVDSAYLAELAFYGSLPAGIIQSPGTTLKAFVLFLTADQLKLVDKTESRGTYYDLVEIKESCKLANGEYLYPIYTYIPKKPFLVTEDKKPIRLEALKASDEKFKGLNQKEVLEYIFRNFFSEEESKDLALNLFNKPITKKDSRIQKIQQRITDKYSKSFDFTNTSSEKEKIFSFFTPSPIIEGSFQVLGTSIRSDAGSNYICELNSSILKNNDIANGSYVLLLNEVEDPFLDKHRIFAIQANCLKNDFLKSNEIRVDQSIRDALGLKKGEGIRIVKSRLKKPPFYERLFNYQYVFCRVKRSEIVDMEKRMVRIFQDTMEIIGIEPGDIIVIESEFESVKNRAFEISVDAVKKRIELEKKSSKAFLEAKAAGTAGGIFDIDCTSYFNLTLEGEDIPPIYMDKEMRDKLRVGFCDAVRIRRTAMNPVEREFTDFVMIIIIAMLGIVLTIPNLSFVASISIIVSIIIVAVILITMKIRHQIS